MDTLHSFPTAAITNNYEFSDLTQIYYLTVLEVERPKWVLWS